MAWSFHWILIRWHLRKGEWKNDEPHGDWTIEEDGEVRTEKWDSGKRLDKDDY